MWQANSVSEVKTNHCLTQQQFVKVVLAMPVSWLVGCVGEVCAMLTQSVRSKPVTHSLASHVHVVLVRPVSSSSSSINDYRPQS